MIDGQRKPKNSVRRALSLSFVQTAISLVFSFGAIIIVSHLLTPAEIGVYSIAAGIMALVHMLRDFGVGEYLVQRTVLDERTIRTVFTINIAIAWTLAIVVFSMSGFAGRFYGDVGVARVLRALSIVLVLLPFGTTPMVLMKRDLEFGRITKIRIAENITRSSLTVALAYAGFTYMSMAWSSVASITVSIGGCALWGWQYRMKGLSLHDWRRVLRFGSSRTISDIVSQVGSQSANLIIGRMLGMTDTGLYSRGYGVVNMYKSNIVGAVNTVAFPAFAREHRETGTAPQLFLKALVYLTGLSWPFFAAGVLLAFPIIRVVFGDQWDAAVPLMRWLCAASIVGALTYQCNQFLVALGHVDTVTRIEVEYQVIRIAITIAAAFYSLMAVAAVQILVYAIATVIYYRELQRYPGLSPLRCARALLPSVWITLATCIVPAVVVAWPGFVKLHMVLALCIAVPGGCVGWLICVRLVRHPLLDEFGRVMARFPRLRRVFAVGEG